MIEAEKKKIIIDPYEEVRIQNLRSFASATAEQKIQWLEETLQSIWEIREQNK